MIPRRDCHIPHILDKEATSVSILGSAIAYLNICEVVHPTIISEVSIFLINANKYGTPINSLESMNVDTIEIGNILHIFKIYTSSKIGSIFLLASISHRNILKVRVKTVSHEDRILITLEGCVGDVDQAAESFCVNIFTFGRHRTIIFERTVCYIDLEKIVGVDGSSCHSATPLESVIRELNLR